MTLMLLTVHVLIRLFISINVFYKPNRALISLGREGNSDRFIKFMYSENQETINQYLHREGFITVKEKNT